jgi:alkylation response protein AidB-like acyl-CoA dehydrogenase
MEYGGMDGTNLGMAVIREHLACNGLGLHCDLQNEHAIVGNNVGLLLMLHYGTDVRKAAWVDDLAEGRRHFAFGITEPRHGSDATHMETTAILDGGQWVINGEKTWNTGVHVAQYDPIFAPTVSTSPSGTRSNASRSANHSPPTRRSSFPWSNSRPSAKCFAH